MMFFKLNIVSDIKYKNKAEVSDSDNRH
jgi:hypothetical protein